MLFLHGTPSPSTDFSPLIAALAPNHRLLVADLPGYCGEPPQPGPNRFAQTTAALVSELDRRALREVAVVGFSGGAYRAVALACEHPERVSRLVLLGGLVQIDATLRAAWKQTAGLLRQGADLRGMFPSLMLSDGYAAAHPEAVAEVKKWADVVSTADLANEFDSFVEAPDYGPAFGRLRIPITLRTGGLDRAAPPPLAQVAGRLNPTAVIQIVPDRGHALLIEDRQATVAAVSAALG